MAANTDSSVIDEDLLEEFGTEWIDTSDLDLTSDFTENSSPDEGPSEAHLQVLKNSFGHSTFRPMQWKIINSVMNEKRDNCAIMSTGYGKSLCFQFPAVYTEAIVLIISPLISLMEDQVLAMKIANIPACLLGSANSNQSETIRDIFRNKYNLVYLTPEFCCGDMGQSFLRDMYRSLSIKLIAVDEAHCVSSWGHDFRPQFRKLHILKQLMPTVPILAVTATATSKVRNDIINVLKLKDPQVLCSGFDRPNFFYEVHTRTNNVCNDFKPFLIKDEDVLKFPGPTIIYCITRKATESLSEDLSELGINCRAYHAGMSIKDRKMVHELFVKDKIDAVIATIAFGMGIDKPDVRQVIHYGISSSIEAYIQESGRAGRDGLPAKCVVMYKPLDMNTYRQIWRVSKIPSNMMEKKQKALNIVEEYLQTTDCRRQFILSYFEDPSRIALHARPDCCDNCRNNTPTAKDSLADADWEVLKDVKNLLTLVHAYPSYGEKSYQNFLMGKSKQKQNFQTHSAMFRSGRSRHAESWDYIVGLLIKKKYLSRKFEQKQYYGYNALSLTRNGAKFLEEEIDELMEKNKDKVPIVKNEIIHEPNISSTQFLSQAVHEEGKSELLQLLRDKRLEMARQEDIMPYMIASDRALISICEKMPCSMEELENCQLEGFNKVRMLKYGENFLKVVRSYNNVDATVTRRTIQEILLMNPLSSSLGNTIKLTLTLFNQYQDIKKVAEKRSFVEGTVITHLTRAMEFGHPIKLSHFGVTEEIRNMIIETIMKLDTGYSLLTPIKLRCPDHITYIQIKAVATYLKVREHLKKLNVPYEDFEDFSYGEIEMEFNREAALEYFIDELKRCVGATGESNFNECRQIPEESDLIAESLIESALKNEDEVLLDEEPVAKKVKSDLSGLDSPPNTPISTESREVNNGKRVVENTDTANVDSEKSNVVTRVVRKTKKSNPVKLPPWLVRK